MNNSMFNQQYNRQITFYRWSLVLCIVALSGYTIYFLFERYTNHYPLFVNNKSLLFRSGLIVYYSFLLVYIDRFPGKIFKLTGFFIAVPLGWMISVISFLTIGYEGITVTGFIFLIMASAIVFDFGIKAFSLSLVLITAFHFTLLSFYPEAQPEDMLNHVFLLGLSGILGLTTNYLVNIIKKNEAKVLQEREILLREIHHRVKNNLQLISSLLNLQAGTLEDSYSKAAVHESQSRVKSMALIHRLLYESERFSDIDFPKYLRELMASIHGSFQIPGTKILYTIQAENILLDIEKAIPLGLITNELVTNAYKYAFSSRKEGTIALELLNAEEDAYIFKLADDGCGLPENFNIEQCESLGLKLVKLLTSQIDGTLEIDKGRGTTFFIRFAVISKN